MGVVFRKSQIQCCEKSKKTGIINIFLYFAWGIPMIKKQKVVIVQTPEWKFKASIARNAT